MLCLTRQHTHIIHITMQSENITAHFATFEYNEADATAQKRLLQLGKIGYPLRRSAVMLPFVMINRTDDYADIMLIKPYQLNWGFGPAMPQRFYRINLKTWSVGVFYEPTDVQYDQRGFPHIIKNDLYIHNDRIKIIQSRCECCICMNIYTESVLFRPCMHIVCCVECSERIRKCPICRGDIKRRYKCTKI